MAAAIVLTDEIAASMRVNSASEDADLVDTNGDGTGLRVREGGRVNETRETIGGRETDMDGSDNDRRGGCTRGAGTDRTVL